MSALQEKFRAVDLSTEGQRIADASADWRRWGPYLSERQWGTVREDYSADGSSWDYLPHDQARSRAYRWGEDGIAGFADDRQLLCLSLALWNGCDSILKERLFGLSNAEGNHGEDVKELYYYLDGVPSHAYMRMLYKYPQSAFPYSQLVQENSQRGLRDREFELLDTGAFDDDRYFDVEIEYAKADLESIVMLITTTNRGPAAAPLWLLPQMWARNTWSWRPGVTKPSLAQTSELRVRIEHPDLPELQWQAEIAPTWLFAENETNARRFGEPDAVGPFKDAFHEWLVDGRLDAVATEPRGTKVAALYRLDLAPGERRSVCMLLSPPDSAPPTESWRAIVADRRAEADAYFDAIAADIAGDDRRLVHRQALAGLLWSKQYYDFDVRQWLEGDPLLPKPPERRHEGRDAQWPHIVNAAVIAMPDKWEYPWYAAWDLAIHCVTHARLDLTFAKSQLELLTHIGYMSPSGQLPAYEGGFGQANPPIHAWAALEIYRFEEARNGNGDLDFLKRVFHKLTLNFMWWVNRQDGEGRNIFEGGFLGLDNIGPFDRNKALPDGGSIDQCDGTGWVAAYALDLMRMALELALHDVTYEEVAAKFFEHFLYIAKAAHSTGGLGETGLWDEADGFYYDVLCLPNQPNRQVRIRSMVGLIPLLAVDCLALDTVDSLPGFRARLAWFQTHRPDLCEYVAQIGGKDGGTGRLLALMCRDQLERVLARLFDEEEFLSPHGLRALSKHHQRHPATIECGDRTLTVAYAPGESTSDDFGGNSNWRGPVWFPVNLLLIRALQRFHAYYGGAFTIEFPTRSGRQMNLGDIAQCLAERLDRLFLRDEADNRPCFGNDARLQRDPNFRDHLLFHEYFDGDTGRGCGASHQTGWTAAAALLLEPIGGL